METETIDRRGSAPASREQFRKVAAAFKDMLGANDWETCKEYGTQATRIALEVGEILTVVDEKPESEGFVMVSGVGFVTTWVFDFCVAVKRAKALQDLRAETTGIEEKIRTLKGEYDVCAQKIRARLDAMLSWTVDDETLSRNGNQLLAVYEMNKKDVDNFSNRINDLLAIVRQKIQAVSGQQDEAKKNIFRSFLSAAVGIAKVAFDVGKGVEHIVEHIAGTVLDSSELGLDGFCGILNVVNIQNCKKILDDLHDCEEGLRKLRQSCDEMTKRNEEMLTKYHTSLGIEHLQ